MSPDPTLLAVIIGLVIVLLALLDRAPKIIEAIGGARLAQRHVEPGWSDNELSLAVIAAVRRTDPELDVEQAERLAEDVIIDLDRGVLTAGIPNEGPDA